MDIMDGTRGNGLSHLKNGVDYINPGKEDQMEIYGYRRNKKHTFLTWLLIVLTCGLLRLIFHWIPHLMIMFTHSKCPLEEADTVLLIERFQGKHASHYVKKLYTIVAEDVVKNSINKKCLIDEPVTDCATKDEPIDTTIATKKDEIPPTLSIHLYGGNFKQVSSILTFKCKKVTYIWDNERSEFMKLIGLDNDVLLSTLHQMPGLSEHEQFLRKIVYGNNEMIIPVKSFLTLLGCEILNPFYVFQIFSFILWLCDNYYKYAAVIMTMTGIGIFMEVCQTQKNQRKLRSTLHSSDVATVMIDRTTGKTESITTERLVPGDILVIPPHGCLMPCDAVLLTGNCILNESMLTGESVPVTKTPIPSSNEITYDTKEHARHTLFCGTKIIQTRYFGGEKVLAVVVRTSFDTSKGELVRSIMYPAPVDFKFEQDSYKFVALLAVIANIGVIYTVITKIIEGIQPVSEIARRALDLYTILIPPALPTAMSVGRFVAQRRLEKKKIYCTSPRAINVAGSINCICFDKTGTLTEDGLDMWGIVRRIEKKFITPEKDIANISIDETIIGMATCHGITIIDGQLVGDPLDLKMFESTGWILEEPDVSDTTKFSMMFPTIVKPPQDKNNFLTPKKNKNDSIITPLKQQQNSITSSDIIDDNISLSNFAISDNEINEEQGLQIGIVRQFPFTSSLQRMSVITRTLGASHYEVYCKGSPEMILSLSKPESIPTNFSSILQEYTSEGYRVIALAHKTLTKLSYPKVQRMNREIAESDLTFLTFVILENRLKPETTPAIEKLNRAHIKIVMVTGDNMLTALSVARDCDMIKPEISVIAVSSIMQHQNNTKPQLYFTKSNSQSSPMSPIIGQGSISEMTDLNSIASLETIESGSFTNATNVGGGGGDNDKYLTDNNIYSSNKYIFSMTGTTWTTIKNHYPELIPKLVTRGAIFARMSPDQKQQLVQEFQSLGYYVAMVGDGANDCGALRAAHIGISLSDTESSVASPFTSKLTNISCVLSVIQEGRAALVTSTSIFKYMAGYSLIQFISVMILYSVRSNLTDMEFLYIDLFIISAFAYFGGNTEAYDGPLAKRPPLTSLISTSPILSLFLQLVIVAIFQFISFWHIQQMSWFTPFIANTTSDTEETKCYENYAIFIISSMQYIILAIVFSKGQPYRKSIFTNYGLLGSLTLLTLFSIYLAIDPMEKVKEHFELKVPNELPFKIILIVYGFVNFVIALFVEYFIIDYVIVKKWRYQWHDIDKSKKKFLAIERDLGNNHKWPPLSQEPLPEAAPDILIRQNTVTEIKIEKKIPDSIYQPDSGFLNSPVISADFNRFGSVREVTLNPRSLFYNERDTVSMSKVPICLEDRELNKIKQPKLDLITKRRHNSESEKRIYCDDEIEKNKQINYSNRLKKLNTIATLPRNHQISQQNQKFINNSNHDNSISNGTQSVLELDILPS
ncbi:polyamine-transporting ATPase 13A3 isoform X2 [Aphidius gifuensis]|uniref:polyamine-transporting ATPase 13A3 isoform X2 n=1 Tax=Aphidius gifuensis TaxID=684658 RepID=UPI001CDBC590|nr:polyamine-transporting ATPase 13A3 isoform X2 [Aphidius gifuensis]